MQAHELQLRLKNDSMDWLNILAATAGSVLTIIITALLRTISANKSAELNSATKFREDLIKRQNHQENRIELLEKEVGVWKRKYYRMYAFLSNFCAEQGIPFPKFDDENE